MLVECATDSSSILGGEGRSIASDREKLRYALEIFENAVRLNPTCREAWLGRGQILSALGHHDWSLESIERAFTLQEASRQDLIFYATSQFHAGRWTDAVESFDRALCAKRDWPEAWLKRGALLHCMGRFEEAIASFDFSLDHDPTLVESLCQRGASLAQLGRFDEALVSYDRALALQPEYGLAWCGRANVCAARNEFSEAEENLRKGLAFSPDSYEGWINLGKILTLLGRPEDAIATYERAITLGANREEGYILLGTLLEQARRDADALIAYRHAVKLNPKSHSSGSKLGQVELRLGEYAAAAATISATLALEPSDDAAKLRLATALWRLDRHEEALVSVNQYLSTVPHDHTAIVLRGALLEEAQQLQVALDCYNLALTLKPDEFDTRLRRGRILALLKRSDAALEDIAWALQQRPDIHCLLIENAQLLWSLFRFAEALPLFERYISLYPENHAVAIQHANALIQCCRPHEAISSLERILVRDPDFCWAKLTLASAFAQLGRYEDALALTDTVPEVHESHSQARSIRADIFLESGKLDEAEAVLKTILELRPDEPEALVRLGAVEEKRGNDAGALTFYDRAIATDPQARRPKMRRAALLHKHGRTGRVIQDLRKVGEADPEHPYALGDLFHLQLKRCVWKNFRKKRVRLENGLRAGKLVVSPFVYNGLSRSPLDTLNCAKLLLRHEAAYSGPAREFSRSAAKKIRIGYLSGEMYEHAAMFLTVGLFESHCRQRFEVYAINNGKFGEGPFSERLRKSFDVIVDIDGLPTAQAAQRIAENEIDILVDLNGLFGNSRRDVFAVRSAPVQVNFLGYPGTTGSASMDYIIADKDTIPPGEEQYHAERVVRMPGSYQVNDDKRPIADKIYTREDCGLPKSGFIFCSFNSPYKILPETFSLWMRILKRVSGSVLWVHAEEEVARKNLREEAAKRGVDGQKLFFASYLPPAEHLARIQVADLQLDTLPCNAHTTASDALWAGLPLLTCPGKTFSGRVAASLLRAANLPDLIADDLKEYERLAVRLATDPAMMRSIRERVAQAKRGSSLFDTDGFRRHLEIAYCEMWRRYLDEKKPEAFDVASIVTSLQTDGVH